MTDATEHSVAAKRRRKLMQRKPIPDAQPMGRTGGRDDRKRWHLLDHTKPICGRVEAGAIIWHAPYVAVKDQLICSNCHGRFSWAPMPHEYELEDHGYDTPCWMWPRGVDTPGYAIRGRPDRRGNFSVHREAYEQEHGAIPEGYVVHHLCGQKTCLNPDHLEAMSRADHLRLHRIWRNSPRSERGRRRV